MTREAARQILGLEPSFSAAELKSAFRRRAFETHPDRGGTAAQFLEVQAAFEFLAQYTGQHFHEAFENNSELEQHIADIERAFESVERETLEYIDQAYQRMGDQIIAALNSYDSHSTLERRIERDVKEVWQRFATNVCHLVDERIAAVADSQERWIQAYLEPAIQAAMRLNPPRWYETASFFWYSSFASLAILPLAIFLKHYWLLAGVVFSLVTAIVDAWVLLIEIQR